MENEEKGLRLAYGISVEVAVLFERERNEEMH